MKTVIYLDKRLFSCLELTQNNCQTVISYFLSVPMLNSHSITKTSVEEKRFGGIVAKLLTR